MADTPPYSRVRRTTGLLFTAGILGTTPGGLPGTVGEQLTAAFDNLAGLLASHGASLSDVVRLVVYLTDIDAMAELNEVFVHRFDEPRPARTTVGVAALPTGALVEVEATVAVTD